MLIRHVDDAPVSFGGAAAGQIGRRCTRSPFGVAAPAQRIAGSRQRSPIDRAPAPVIASPLTLVVAAFGAAAAWLLWQYVASKHGVVGFTKGVALETATTGITCNAICPGWVLTPLVEKQIDALAAREKLSPEEARVKLLGEKQPSLEFATPEQLGALATFLCSDAAAQLNGAALPVDGGWLAR